MFLPIHREHGLSPNPETLDFATGVQHQTLGINRIIRDNKSADYSLPICVTSDKDCRRFQIVKYLLDICGNKHCARKAQRNQREH